MSTHDATMKVVNRNLPETARHAWGRFFGAADTMHGLDPGHDPQPGLHAGERTGSGGQGARTRS